MCSSTPSAHTHVALCYLILLVPAPFPATYPPLDRYLYTDGLFYLLHFLRRSSHVCSPTVFCYHRCFYLSPLFVHLIFVPSPPRYHFGTEHRCSFTFSGSTHLPPSYVWADYLYYTVYYYLLPFWFISSSHTCARIPIPTTYHLCTIYHHYTHWHTTIPIFSTFFILQFIIRSATFLLIHTTHLLLPPHYYTLPAHHLSFVSFWVPTIPAVPVLRFLCSRHLNAPRFTFIFARSLRHRALTCTFLPRPLCAVSHEPLFHIFAAAHTLHTAFYHTLLTCSLCLPFRLADSTSTPHAHRYGFGFTCPHLPATHVYWFLHARAIHVALPTVYIPNTPYHLHAVRVLLPATVSYTFLHTFLVVLLPFFTLPYHTWLPHHRFRMPWVPFSVRTRFWLHGSLPPPPVWEVGCWRAGTRCRVFAATAVACCTAGSPAALHRCLRSVAVAFCAAPFAFTPAATTARRARSPLLPRGCCRAAVPRTCNRRYAPPPRTRLVCTPRRPHRTFCRLVSYPYTCCVVARFCDSVPVQFCCYRSLYTHAFQLQDHMPAFSAYLPHR